MLVDTSEILLFFSRSPQKVKFLTSFLMSDILDFLVCARAVASLEGKSADNSRLISINRPSKIN